MPWLDTSIYLISLFGFILVLGIVVDDAIVVGESVFSEYQEKKPQNAYERVSAAISGTKLVSVPVTFAVLTTAIAFFPLLNLPGFQGKFLKAIPMVVIPTLLFSLVESKVILPYHLSFCRVGSGDRKLNALGRLQKRISGGLEWAIRTYYEPLLAWVLKWRYPALACFSGMLALMVAFIYVGVIRWVPFPSVPSDYIFVNLTYPQGTPVEVTRAGQQRIKDALEGLIEANIEAGRGNPVEHISASLGTTISGGGPAGTDQGSAQSHKASVVVELKKSEERATNDGAVELANRWREAIGQLPGVKSLTFDAQAAGGQGAPVDIQVTSRRAEDLRPIADRIKAQLERFDGLYDIRDNLDDSQKEIKLSLKPRAELLGLTQAQLGQQVRAAFFGIEAQRVQRGRDDVRVMVRYPSEDRRSIADLEGLRIRTPGGLEVPFSEVAEVDLGTGYASIQRQNRQRIVNITADADKRSIDVSQTLANLNAEILPALMAEFPGASYRLRGETEEAAEGNAALLSSGILVMILMYAMLAIPFKSYFQPLIVMGVIPFGLIGAFGGHLLMDRPLSTLSIYGIMALAGVVVNDSLVLVDYINRQVREAGMPMKAALLSAGTRRFRPILLTSLTTFFGLSPILLEKSLQAQFLIPMAISLSFGIVFATLITLLLVPILYLVLEDVGSFLKDKPRPSQMEVNRSALESQASQS
jgi:multidrug efflux pump subunit AcrB